MSESLGVAGVQREVGGDPSSVVPTSLEASRGEDRPGPADRMVILCGL